MFAEFGTILFEVVGSPRRIESRRRYGYAQHKVIGALPQMQWIGDELQRIQLDLLLHYSFTDPEAQAALLFETASLHQAMPLVLGDGTFMGYFVIESIATSATQLGPGATPIAIEMTLRLCEYPLNSTIAAAASAASTAIALVSSVGSSGAPTLAQSSAGASALLSIPTSSAPATPTLQPGDVPVAVITRSESQ